MVSRSVQEVQLVHLSTDPVQLAVEVLDGRRVAVFVLCAEKSGDQRRLADAR